MSDPQPVIFENIAKPPSHAFDRKCNAAVREILRPCPRIFPHRPTHGAKAIFSCQKIIFSTEKLIISRQKYAEGVEHPGLAEQQGLQLQRVVGMMVKHP